MQQPEGPELALNAAQQAALIAAREIRRQLRDSAAPPELQHQLALTALDVVLDAFPQEGGKQ